MRSTITATRLMLVSGVSLGALLAVPVSAQVVAPTGGSAAAQSTAGAADDAVGGIDDIIVTAQRVGQSLQDVPIAISAFTAEALEKQQIDNSSDLQLSLPNVTFTKSNFTGATFTIRGVGDLCVGGTCDSATAIHANDLPLFGTRLFETEFFDLERIEVLRGPQGTLFGRNATAGVVNFITAKPELGEFRAGIEGEYANYESYKAKGFINIPLGETLGVRLAGTYLKRDGYTKNLFNGDRIDDRDQYAVRGSLRCRGLLSVRATKSGRGSRKICSSSTHSQTLALLLSLTKAFRPSRPMMLTTTSAVRKRPSSSPIEFGRPRCLPS